MSTVTAPTEPPAQPPALLRTQGSASIRVVRAELLKIWTTNTWWVFGIISLAFTALLLLANVWQASSELDYASQAAGQPMPDFGQPSPERGGPTAEDIRNMRESYLDSVNVGRILIRSAANVFTSGQFMNLLLMVLLGALIVTNEYFHQTATTTFLTEPRRTRVILGKLAAAVALAFTFWLVITAISVAVGSVFFSVGGYGVPLGEWTVLRSVLMNLLAYVIWAVLGVGLGVLIRSQLGATITGAAFYLLSFPVALAAFGLIRTYVIKQDWVWNLVVLVPGMASTIMISPVPISLGINVSTPAWWVGAVVLVGYGVLAGLTGTAIMRKRDIS
jgi:ABC-2 type transport system permease protein